MDSMRGPLNTQRTARTRHKISPTAAPGQPGEQVPPRRRLPPQGATDLLATHRPQTRRPEAHRRIVPDERGVAPAEAVVVNSGSGTEARIGPTAPPPGMRPQANQSHDSNARPHPQPRSRSMFARRARRVGVQAGRPNLNRKPRRPLWHYARRGVLVLLGVAAVEVAAVAFTGPQLRVAAVDVVGLDATPADSVHREADKLIDKNWLLARTRPVTAAVKALPTVRDAQIVRTLTWPPRLTVRVQERVPYARVGVSGQWWIVDEAGLPFRLANAGDADLNAVTGPAFKPLLGQTLPSETWKPVVEFTSMLSDPAQAGGHWALRRIYFDKQGFASLRVMDGSSENILVRLGRGQWRQKLVRARATLAYFQKTGRRAQALNLISYSRPTWTPREPRPDELTHMARASDAPATGSTSAKADGDLYPRAARLKERGSELRVSISARGLLNPSRTPGRKPGDPT